MGWYVLLGGIYRWWISNTYSTYKSFISTWRCFFFCSALLEHYILSFEGETTCSVFFSQPKQSTIENSGKVKLLIQDPEDFDGTRSKFTRFLTRLALMFSSDPARYNNDAAKIAYAASYLTGSAADWFEPHLNKTMMHMPPRRESCGHWSKAIETVLPTMPSSRPTLPPSGTTIVPKNRSSRREPTKGSKTPSVTKSPCRTILTSCFCCEYCFYSVVSSVNFVRPSSDLPVVSSPCFFFPPTFFLPSPSLPSLLVFSFSFSHLLSFTVLYFSLPLTGILSQSLSLSLDHLSSLKQALLSLLPCRNIFISFRYTLYDNLYLATSYD